MSDRSLIHQVLTSALPYGRPTLTTKIIAVVLVLIGWLPAQAKDVKPYEKFDSVSGPPMQNFDPLEGVWSVESHSLKKRMAEEKKWLRNDMETTYRIRLGGLVAMNETYGTFNGKSMHGFMIRTYDPDKDEWLFQWMSRGYPHLTEQVRGRFENGIGTFYGSETHAGQTYRMRFRWRLITTDHAFWEQAYQSPKTNDWEVNWTLDLKRKPKEPAE